MPGEDVLLRKIREEERFLERSREVLETEDNPVRHGDMGRSALTKGICCLLLDRRDDARDSFLDAHQYFLRRVDAGGDSPFVPVVLRNALFAAVLGDDWEAAVAAAERILNHPVDPVGEDGGAEESLQYARAIAGPVVGDEDVMMEAASWLLDNTEGSGVEVYRGAGGYVFGVLNDDKEMVLGGIDRVLNAHREGVPMEGRSFDEAICLPATALTVIAWRRGYDIEIDSEFVPVDRDFIL